VARTALVTGATGFIGGRLARALVDREWEVRCLVRDTGRARDLAERGLDLHEGDLLDAESLRGAGDGVDVAYYLVHAMGRGGDGDFEERERRSAAQFAEMAAREGVGRTVYLGGLGDNPGSTHLRSRHRTAEVLAERGPPLTYFRAGMVVGAGSESYRTLRYLVERLPAMIAPAWLATPTQPVGIDDVIAYLVAAPDVDSSEGREIQIGGPDVLSYAEMLDRMADALAVRRRPRVPIPLLTPWLSSLWIGFVTPVDAAVARPLIEGLSTETTVTDPSGAAEFDVAPTPFSEALRRALDEDPDAGSSSNTPALRLLPDRLERVPRTGAVGSTQAGEMRLPDGVPASRVIGREFLADAAPEYWRFVTRVTLGAIRIVEDRDELVLVLLGRPLALLRFRRPEYELEELSGSVTWPISRGVLVARNGRDQGFLRLSVTDIRRASSADSTRVRLQMEVRNFYPWIRGAGRFARIGAWLYGETQQRMHRVITRSFLRSLAAAPLLHLTPRRGVEQSGSSPGS
jgi:uncharacterized protein YbjT (DUF2867 family)